MKRFTVPCTLLVAAVAAWSLNPSAVAAEPAQEGGGDEASAEAAAPSWISPRERQMLLNGRGMGMGRVAVAAGHPGPMHVLQKAEELALSEQQIADTTALRERVHERSRELGESILEAEQALGDVLAAEPVDRAAMREALERIAGLRADLRAAHIEAHLDLGRLLNDEQREKMATMEMPSHERGQRGFGRQLQERRRMHRGQRDG